MKSERRQTYAIGIVVLQQAHALKCVMAGGLTTIDVENFACDELCSVEVHHGVNDIRDLSHTPPLDATTPGPDGPRSDASGF